jgi:hypothetical protein
MVLIQREQVLQGRETINSTTIKKIQTFLDQHINTDAKLPSKKIDTNSQTYLPNEDRKSSDNPN